MKIRILNIIGRDEASRRAHLAEVEAWMTRHGWRLVDYSDDSHSAMFERSGDGPRLAPLHPTRWMPGPGLWHPRTLLTYLVAEPRMAYAMMGVALVLVFGVMIVRHPPAFLTSSDALRKTAAQQASSTGNWRYVNVGALNLRSAPHADARIVGILYRNQKVRVEEVVNGWARISKPESGYVSIQYVQEAPVQ